MILRAAGALVLLTLLVSRPAHATILVQAWQAARTHDRVLAVARADHAAALTKREQGDALWRPTVSASAGVGLGSADTRMSGAQFSAPGMGTTGGVHFATSMHAGAATRLAITAQQPLLSRAREVQRAQLNLAADLADSAWHAAQQDAMLRTAERYLGVAVAQERLRVTERQQRSVQQATQEAHDRFRLGASPVTEAHEADAALAGLVAQRSAAELELALRRQALTDSTGLTISPERLPLDSGAPLEPLEHWLKRADADNALVRQQHMAVELARQTVRQHEARAGITADLVAQAGRDQLNGSGDFGRAGNRAFNGFVGVQVSVPLYTGGMRDAQAREALRLLDKAQAQLEATREQVASEVRSVWLGLQTAQARIGALTVALKASAARLDATRVGRAVGDRTTLDVLNAENDHAAATLALVEARSAQSLNRLKLAALAGRLDEAQLAQVDPVLP